MQDSLILNQAIADGLDVIGDRWTILILRSAFYGVKRFDEFQAATGASRSTLTRRLKALIKHDILYKHPYNLSATRFEYLFTDKGLGLIGPSLLAAKWESDWKTSNYVDMTDRLFHKTCESYMEPKVVCRACQQHLLFSDVSWPDRDENLGSQLAQIRTYNTQNRKRVNGNTDEANNYNLASLIGDRWTLLVLIAAFFGTHRYDAFLNRLNTPPSVLTVRLKQLVSNGIFERIEYQNNPPRYNYNLTEKGQTLFPFVMGLRQWVSERLQEPSVSSPLVHTACGQPLAIDIVCNQCNQHLQASELKFNK